MKPEKRYVVPWNGAVNRIAFRVPRPSISIIASSPLEDNFSTFSEAKLFLIDKRKKDLENAERRLKNAKINLRKATAISEHP